MTTGPAVEPAVDPTVDPAVGAAVEAGRREPLATATVLTLLAAVAAAVASVPSLMTPELLRGEAVTDGNLRGTALVVLAVGLPLLLLTLRPARRGSAPATIGWLAGLLYLSYQGLLFCFGTPMNRLFPAYVAMLGLAGWAAATLLRALEPERTAHGLARSGRLPRSVPLVLGGLAALNALAWLARAVPVAWTGDPPASVSESGLPTSPVLVQDLALWLPFALVVAVWAWRARPWGTVLAPAVLLFYAVEGWTVASDQWWGAHADDGHPAVASLDAVPVGLATGVVLAGFWLWVLRRGRS